MNARDTAASNKGDTAGRAGKSARDNPYTSPDRRAIWEDARAIAATQPDPKPKPSRKPGITPLALAVLA